MSDIQPAPIDYDEFQRLATICTHAASLHHNYCGQLQAMGKPAEAANDGNVFGLLTVEGPLLSKLGKRADNINEAIGRVNAAMPSFDSLMLHIARDPKLRREEPLAQDSHIRELMWTRLMLAGAPPRDVITGLAEAAGQPAEDFMIAVRGWERQVQEHAGTVVKRLEHALGQGRAA